MNIDIPNSNSLYVTVTDIIQFIVVRRGDVNRSQKCIDNQFITSLSFCSFVMMFSLSL